MTTMPRNHVLLAGLFMTACAVEAPDALSQEERALLAPGGDECATVSLTTVESILVPLEAGLALAVADEAASGSQASRWNREGFERVIGEVHRVVDYLRQDGSDVTTPAKAPAIGLLMGEVMRVLPHNGHWGVVAAADRQSEDARASFELQAQALELANDLRARAYRCYMQASFRD
jgi:hypothetical protein